MGDETRITDSGGYSLQKALLPGHKEISLDKDSEFYFFNSQTQGYYPAKYWLL